MSEDAEHWSLQSEALELWGEGRLAEAREKYEAAIALCPPRSEEHTSELQSRRELVCRLLLENKICRLAPCATVSPPACRRSSQPQSPPLQPFSRAFTRC